MSDFDIDSLLRGEVVHYKPTDSYFVIGGGRVFIYEDKELTKLIAYEPTDLFLFEHNNSSQKR